MPRVFSAGDGWIGPLSLKSMSQREIIWYLRCRPRPSLQLYPLFCINCCIIFHWRKQQERCWAETIRTPQFRNQIKWIVRLLTLKNVRDCCANRVPFRLFLPPQRKQSVHYLRRQWMTTVWRPLQYLFGWAAGQLFVATALPRTAADGRPLIERRCWWRSVRMRSFPVVSLFFFPSFWPCRCSCRRALVAAVVDHLWSGSDFSHTPVSPVKLPRCVSCLFYSTNLTFEVVAISVAKRG